MSFESTAEGRVGVDGADRRRKTVPHVGTADRESPSSELITSLSLPSFPVVKLEGLRDGVIVVRGWSPGQQYILNTVLTPENTYV